MELFFFLSLFLSWIPWNAFLCVIRSTSLLRFDGSEAVRSCFSRISMEFCGSCSRFVSSLQLRFAAGLAVSGVSFFPPPLILHLVFGCWWWSHIYIRKSDLCSAFLYWELSFSFVSDFVDSIVVWSSWCQIQAWPNTFFARSWKWSIFSFVYPWSDHWTEEETRSKSILCYSPGLSRAKECS